MNAFLSAASCALLYLGSLLLILQSSCEKTSQFLTSDWGGCSGKNLFHGKILQPADSVSTLQTKNVNDAQNFERFKGYFIF